MKIFDDTVDALGDNIETLGDIIVSVVDQLQFFSNYNYLKIFKDKILFDLKQRNTNKSLAETIEKTEQKAESYLKEAYESKYGWRDYYVNKQTFGLNPEDFEEYQDFAVALEEAVYTDEYKKAIKDDKVYKYCGIVFGASKMVYSYRYKDMDIKVGDMVVIPTASGREVTEKVVCVGEFMALVAPYPPDKSRFVIRKIENN